MATAIIYVMIVCVNPFVYIPCLSLSIMYSPHCSHGSTGHKRTVNKKIFKQPTPLIPSSLLSSHNICLVSSSTVTITSFVSLLSHRPNFGHVHLICVTLKLYPSIYLQSIYYIPYSVMLGIMHQALATNFLFEDHKMNVIYVSYLNKRSQGQKVSYILLEIFSFLSGGILQFTQGRQLGLICK